MLDRLKNKLIIFLSYFREIILEIAQSDQHEELEVSIYKGQYRLNTKNAIYSWGDKYDNFSGAFEQINISELKPQNVLVLGLGLGSIPYMIERKFGIQTHYDIVEHDDIIIQLAQDYLLADLNSVFNYYKIDGYVFMENNETLYDLICMDIFVDNEIPEVFKQENFLSFLKKGLSPQGKLIFNCLAESKNDQIVARDFFEGTFKLVFPNSKLYAIHYNYMLIVE